MHIIAILLDQKFLENAGKMFTDEEIADALGNFKVTADDTIISKIGMVFTLTSKHQLKIKEKLQTTC